VADNQEPGPSGLPAGAEAAHESAAIAPQFVALFLADHRRLYRYIVALLGTEQDADDVLQETAAVLWRKFSDFESGSSFFAWACKAAFLAVLEYRRRKGREVAPLDQDVLEQIAALSARDFGTAQLRRTALEECLGKLTPRDRTLIDRCYSTNVKTKEVAAELGRPETSVYISLGRIRRALLECIRRTIAVAEREEGSL
jgi:RNA polymerase sigma-70 factor (ECF subfamily)